MARLRGLRTLSRLVVLTRNLLDLSLVRAVVPDAVAARTVEDEELAAADLILLDLTAGLDPDAVVSIGPPVIAYGPHVDARALEAAVEAGCREALPRSRVFRRLPELLG